MFPLPTPPASPQGCFCGRERGNGGGVGGLSSKIDPVILRPRHSSDMKQHPPILKDEQATHTLPGHPAAGGRRPAGLCLISVQDEPRCKGGPLEEQTKLARKEVLPDSWYLGTHGTGPPGCLPASGSPTVGSSIPLTTASKHTAAETNSGDPKQRHETPRSPSKGHPHSLQPSPTAVTPHLPVLISEERKPEQSQRGQTANADVPQRATSTWLDRTPKRKTRFQVVLSPPGSSTSVPGLLCLLLALVSPELPHRAALLLGSFGGCQSM